MSIFLIGILSIALIYCLPFILVFIFCFIIGLFSEVIEVVTTKLKTKKTLPVNPRSEAGKVILNRIERTEEYKLH